MSAARAGAPGWAGSIAFGSDWLLYCGQVGPTDLHAHHADQIVVSAERAPVLIEIGGRVEEKERSRRTRTSGRQRVSDRAGAADSTIEVSGSHLAVDSDTPHAIRRGTPLADVLFVEPGLRRGAPSTPEPLPDLAPPHPIADWSSAATRADAILGARHDDRAISDSGQAELQHHPAVAAALAALPDLVAEGRVSARDLARVTGLSSSRLSHVFAEQTGVPIRSYIRWARVTSAAEHLAAGATLTDAAHEAGFSDGAHFSRTFRSMFGLSPTDVFAAAVFLHP